MSIEKFGGKAYWLDWLIQNGFKVPEVFFIEATQQYSLNSNQIQNLCSFLKKLPYTENQYTVAIRSSFVKEDSFEKSLAGHFKSFLGNFSFEEILVKISEVISDINPHDSESKMGVIIQRKVFTKFSGVIFSSNPISLSKEDIFVSIVDGMGDKLVSGKVEGDNINVKYIDGKIEIPTYKSKILAKHIKKLIIIAKDIETKLGFPVDIEWCVESNTNELYLLQCRPVTGIIPNIVGVIPVDLEHKEQIPLIIRDNDKVKIRLLAQEQEIDISKAHLIVSSSLKNINNVDFNIIPEDRSIGYSIVVLFPKTINGNIVRHFAKIEIDSQNPLYSQKDSTELQKKSNINDILKLIFERINKIYWVTTVIIQQIFEPKFTGIVKKIDGGYLIEIAKGHFVPKGVVPTSQYVLNEVGTILSCNEIVQEYYFRIINGVVKKENINDIISINQDSINSIIYHLKNILNSKTTVEFGLLGEVTKILNPYLIDIVEDHSNNLNISVIKQGIISTGKRTGKALILDITQISANSLDLHYHNLLNTQEIIDDKIIFISETPDIALLNIIGSYKAENIGFIFRKGSALSHFSIILREKKIPAICSQEYFEENAQITIDAYNGVIEINKLID